MKKTWKLVLLAVFGIVLMTGSVIAAENFAVQGKNANGLGLGQGSTREFISDYLNVDMDELRGMRQKGKSFTQIAEELGIDSDELVGAVKDFRINELDKAVEDGLITEEQALSCIDIMEERIKENMDGLPHRGHHGNFSGNRHGNGFCPMDGTGFKRGNQSSQNQ